MTNSSYKINRGINKPIEFKGLKAQYIAYLAAGLVGLLLLFAILYLIGIPTLVILLLIGTCGFVLVNYLYKYSRKYGPYGLMKEGAFRTIPQSLKGRRLFRQLIPSKQKQ